MHSDTAFIAGVSQILFISPTSPTSSLSSSSNARTMHYCVAVTVETLCLGNTFSGWLEDSLPTSAPLWALADASQASWGHRASESCEGHTGCLMNIWLLIRDLEQTPALPVVITVICSWASLAALPNDVLESPRWVRNITVSVMARLKGNCTLCSPGELPLHWQICWGMISFVWQSQYDISKMG